MTILKLFIASLLVSQIAALGADVTCSTNACTSCPTAPTAPGTLTWQTGSATRFCAINSCPAAGTSSGITGASDLFCTSCPGTPNGQVQAIYANFAQNACVAASASCSNTRPPNTWNDADCFICHGTSAQYAKGDYSDCQATPPGADVTCSTNACTSCPTAPTAPGTLTWQTGSATGFCVINSCPAAGTSSGITGASDLFCASCPGTPNGQVRAIYANFAQNACVAASASCSNTRTPNTWNNADCLICHGTSAQYAKGDGSDCQATPPGADVTCSTNACTSCPTAPTAPGTLTWQIGSVPGQCAINSCPAAGTSSGITGASDLFCKSCPGTPNGQVQAIYANFAQNACVAASASCSNTRTPNTWNNADCLICHGTSAKYAKGDGSDCQATPPGADVTCSTNACTSCPTAPTAPGTLTWQIGSVPGQCAINSCPAAGTSSGITGASDLFCKSCPGTPNGQVQAIYANFAQNACVAASASCSNTRTPNTWNNADCLICHGTSAKYAKGDGSDCQATPPGADVTCSTNACTSCPTAPTAPGTLTWQIGSVPGQCAINSCPAAGTSSGITGASDLFCKSCPGTPNGQVQAIYANFAQNACVAASASCSNTRTPNTWNNADCLICHGTSAKYAKGDGSDCQATPPGADVTCSTNACTSCPTAPTAPGTLTWQIGSVPGQCAINSCPAAGTSSGITGASDLFCKSCPGTPNGQVQAIYANTAQNGCVAASATCGNSRTTNTWTNADCLLCHGTSAQYAKGDGSDCQAIPPGAGADVTCSTNACASCPTAPGTLTWQTGSVPGQCAINRCPAAGTSSGITGASDLFCKSCPGTPNGQVQAIYANTAQNGCVAASATCGNTRTTNTWTNADCLACNGTTAQYAKADKSGCSLTAPSSSSSSSTSSSTNSMIILSSVLFLISFLF